MFSTCYADITATVAHEVSYYTFTKTPVSHTNCVTQTRTHNHVRKYITRTRTDPGPLNTPTARQPDTHHLWLGYVEIGDHTHKNQLSNFGNNYLRQSKCLDSLKSEVMVKCPI